MKNEARKRQFLKSKEFFKWKDFKYYYEIEIDDENHSQPFWEFILVNYFILAQMQQHILKQRKNSGVCFYVFRLSSKIINFESTSKEGF